MMKVIKVIFGLLACCMMFSCQQMPEDDTWGFEENTKVLKVKVRSAGESEIQYPLYLYAFTEGGKLAASQTIENAEVDMSLTLPKGDYQVVAVAGVSDSYQLPENPKLTDVITLVGTEGAETPLMVGRADIIVGNASTATTQITLSYVVAALNVKLKDVPAEVTDVQLSLSPLYSNLSMGGEYGGNSQKVVVECEQSSTGVWEAETTYIFPGSGEKTVFSIYFKKQDGTEVTYGYTSQEIPKANHLFNVTGSYVGGIMVGGSFDVADWEGSVEVEFEFGAVEMPDDEEDEDIEIDMSNVPEVGTIWNGTIVADIGEADENGVDLLLMTLDEWEATKDQADEIIADYSVNGISDWRLPNHTEASLLRARFGGEGRLELNDLIAEYDPKLYGLASGDDERYLCLKEGAFYSFKFVSGTTTTQAGNRSYYVRLVKTYRMSLGN